MVLLLHSKKNLTTQKKLAPQSPSKSFIPRKPSVPKASEARPKSNLGSPPKNLKRAHDIQLKLPEHTFFDPWLLEDITSQFDKK